MDKKHQLLELCLDSLKSREIKDRRYYKRLENELIQVDCQDLYDYFLDAHQKKYKWPKNENNALVPYLLNLCHDFDIEKETSYKMGELPDIDVDYLDPIREYIKNEWAPSIFGEDRVSHIGTYGTYQLKQSLIDMTRVFGEDRTEVLNITKQFGTKDDEGEDLTWEKAVELYPAFKSYVEKYPDIAEAAERLLGRNKSFGQHAGGFIISSHRLPEFVPMMINKEGGLVTAWIEGQTSQDLGQFGLVKYDLLSIKMLQQIEDCLDLIYQRHGLETVCSLPSGPNWSDTSYLNDPKCLEEANKANLRFIFQLDSPGIRRLFKQGGVTSFRDIEAYIALYRPGPLNMGMHDTYCKRKNNEEEYEIHPLLKPILEKTYGVMIYQEQIMQVLNKVGLIPMRDCYDVVKAVSKKKIEKFAKYKSIFIENGKKTLGYTEEQMLEFWNQIESFASYGFGKAHSTVYSVIACRQLWLKTYYPVEFFCSMLNHTGNGLDKDRKVRDCKQVAEEHGVHINSPNINKSGVHFSIVGDEIYFGLSHIKHVGQAGVNVIEARERGGPFSDFRDFLDRVECDAKCIQAFVSLGLFDEADSMWLYNYYCYWKHISQSRRQKQKDFAKSIERYKSRLKDITGAEYTLDSKSLEWLVENITDKEMLKKLKTLKRNYYRTITRYKAFREKYYEKGAVPLDEFTKYTFEAKIKDDIAHLVTNREAAEVFFYGFCWTHPVSRCEDAKGLTFDRFRQAEKYPAYVEGLVLSVDERTSKKNKDFKFYSMNLQDVNWEDRYITIWKDEYDRFKDMLQVGNVIRLELDEPDLRFNSYTLKSYPPYRKHLQPSKENDLRMVKLQ